MAGVTTTDLSTAARILGQWLRMHALGRAHACPQAEVRRELALFGLSVLAREIFDLEAELVKAGEPLGSSDRGIFWCEDEADYIVAYQYLVGRFAAMRARAEALERQRHVRFGGAKLF
jgi:hypothetical protein